MGGALQHSAIEIETKWPIKLFWLEQKLHQHARDLSLVTASHPVRTREQRLEKIKECETNVHN